VKIGARDFERFIPKIDVNGPNILETPCWTFTGYINPQGYGAIYFDGPNEIAHRFMYMMVHGPVERGAVIMHRCDNRSCVNPTHLSNGTHALNAADTKAKGRHRGGGNRLSLETKKEIIRLVALGTKRKEIATRLGISIKTTQKYHSEADIGPGCGWRRAEVTAEQEPNDR
jgi:Autographiviridae endonuclease